MNSACPMYIGHALFTCYAFSSEFIYSMCSGVRVAIVSSVSVDKLTHGFLESKTLSATQPATGIPLITMLVACTRCQPLFAG